MIFHYGCFNSKDILSQVTKKYDILETSHICMKIQLIILQREYLIWDFRFVSIFTKSTKPRQYEKQETNKYISSMDTNSSGDYLGDQINMYSIQQSSKYFSVLPMWSIYNYKDA